MTGKRTGLLLLLLLVAAAAIVGALVLHHHRSPSRTLAPEGGVAIADARRPAARASSPAAPPAVAAAARPRSTGETVVKGPWGSQLGQFGRRGDPESNPEGPMAVAALAGGEVAVVDQVNRRVQRFRDGKPTSAVPLGGDTVQDIAAGSDGKTVLLDRLADKNIQIYDQGGKLLNETSLIGKGIPEGGAVTGVFTDDDGIWVERSHEAVVRVADANGTPDPARPELPGRLSRDGKLLVSAEMAGDRASGQVRVSATDRASGQPSWSVIVQLPAPVLHILLLDGDRQGMVYLGAAVGHESSAPPYRVVDEEIAVARLSGGTVRGTLDLPPMATADESFRPLAVEDDGAILEMIPTREGLSVTRYRFP